MELNEITRQIVDAAYRVHRSLGPGLLESVYGVVLADALRNLGLKLERQKPIPIRFEGKIFDEGFQADLVVEGVVLVELKSAEQLARVHKKQVLTYLRLGGLRCWPAHQFQRATVEGKYRKAGRQAVPDLKESRPRGISHGGRGGRGGETKAEFSPSSVVSVRSVRNRI